MDDLCWQLLDPETFEVKHHSAGVAGGVSGSDSSSDSSSESSSSDEADDSDGTRREALRWDKKRGHIRADWRKLSWSAAFSRAIDALTVHYAFSEHRGIDWVLLAAKYGPLVRQAEQTADTGGYICALRDLACELRDAHCEVNTVTEPMQNAQDKRKEQDVGTGYGIVLTRRTDRSVVVTYLFDCARHSKLAVGDSIIEINGCPVDEAVALMSLRWPTPTLLCIISYLG